MQKILTSTSAEQTERLGEQIGKNLRGGEVIELVSDLGGGKTTFTRGLAAGLGVTDSVASPTFTISREYAGGRLRVYHFDFYRLPEAGVIADELAEVVGDPEGVAVVEWAEVVKHVLPEDRLTIAITTTDESVREIQLSTTSKLEYLLGGIS